VKYCLLYWLNWISRNMYWFLLRYQ